MNRSKLTWIWDRMRPPVANRELCSMVGGGAGQGLGIAALKSTLKFKPQSAVAVPPWLL